MSGYLDQTAGRTGGMALSLAIHGAVLALALLVFNKAPLKMHAAGPELAVFSVPDLSQPLEQAPPTPPEQQEQPPVPPQIVKPEVTVTKSELPAPYVVPVADPVPLPRPQIAVPQPVAAPPQPAAPAAAAPPAPSAQTRKQEQNYYATLMDWLNRKRKYPPEAKKARQQGVVVVKFTIDRQGNVLDAVIKKSSGHALLDQETLNLMRRASPLPAIPDSLGKDRLTISLPIEYSLING